MSTPYQGQDTRAPGQDVPRQDIPVHDLYGPDQGQGQAQGQDQAHGQGLGQGHGQDQGQDQGQDEAQGQDHGQDQGQDEAQGQDQAHGPGQGQGLGQHAAGQADDRQHERADVQQDDQADGWQGAYPSYGAYPAGSGYAALSGATGYLNGAEVSFGLAAKDGLRNIVTWRGRASRSAYWWFFLFNVIVMAVVGASYGAALWLGVTLDVIIGIPLALAGLALSIRRLHDTNRSGWWWWIGLIPVVGTIILLIFCLLPSTPGPNRYNTAR